MFTYSQGTVPVRGGRLPVSARQLRGASVHGAVECGARAAAARHPLESVVSDRGGAQELHARRDALRDDQRLRERPVSARDCGLYAYSSIRVCSYYDRLVHYSNSVRNYDGLSTTVLANVLTELIVSLSIYCYGTNQHNS